MENKKIKKIDLLYLLSYIFVPIIITALCFIIGMLYFKEGPGAVILFMCPPIISLIWWVFGGSILFKIRKSKFEKYLDEQGFNRNHTFYGRGSTVVIDEEKGDLALIFFWNPFDKYIFSASRITKAWVNDGKTGAGILEGSMRVSFLFIVDEIKIRVDTFTSNQKWRMDSDYILTGISKADMMVEIINKARVKAHKNNK